MSVEDRFLRFVASCCAVLATQSAFGRDVVAEATSPPAASSLELLVLGSGGPGATGRAASSYLVLIDGAARILVDAGPGSFARLGESGVSLADLDIVLLTHLHVDHVGELPGFVKARAVAVRHPIGFKVFGPQGRRAGGDAAEFPSTTRFVSLLFGPGGAFPYLRDFAAAISFDVTDLPALPPAAEPAIAKILAQDGFEIRAIAGHHRDAPAVIYRIDHAGRSITFSGDIDAAAHPALRRIAQGTDLLVFNSVVLDPPGSPSQLYELHTPPQAIGEIAAAAHVRQLLLSHISPAVDGGRDAVLASIHLHYSGPVELAADGRRVSP